MKERQDGRLGYIPTWSRRASEYLAAPLPLGLEIRRCEEPLRPSPLVDERGSSEGAAAPDHVPGEPPNIWALHRWAPDATNAAYRGVPIAIIWQFQLS